MRLVEKEAELGGNLRHIHYTSKETTARPSSKHRAGGSRNPRIQVFPNAEVKKIDGYIGNFKTAFSVNGTEKEYEHGV